jgi:hypothetical protein
MTSMPFSLCDLQSLEDTAVVDAQASVVGSEDFDGGDPHLHQDGMSFANLLIELSQVHVEGVVDRGFLSFLHPDVYRIFEIALTRRFDYLPLRSARGESRTTKSMTVVVPPNAAAL